MDNFIQITVFCPPEPRVGAFVYRNAGKVYIITTKQHCLGEREASTPLGRGGGGSAAAFWLCICYFWKMVNKTKRKCLSLCF